MVRLTLSDERVFHELQSLLVQVQGHITPLTERVAPVDVLLRAIQKRLSHYDPVVRIAIVGHAGSGKSSFANAIVGSDVLPPNTERSLDITPFDGDEMMLRLPTGKAVAVGRDGVRAHLESEANTFLEELSERQLHTRLPLIRPPHHYAASWRLVDTKKGHCGILPNVSSVASRTHSPNVFTADLLFYCVDASKLGTPGEEELLNELVGDLDVPDTTLSRLIHRTVFVLTHSDVISDEEDCIDRVQRKDFVPPITSIDDLQTHFKNLLVNQLGPAGTLEPFQLVVMSSRNALLTKRILNTEPTIAELYDYCELLFGATFMQTIDNISEENLRGMVRNHARGTAYAKSGGARADEVLRLFDFNAARELMLSLGSTGTECVEQLVAALRLAKPALDVLVQENEEALEVLVSELEWIVRSADEIGRKIGEMANVIIKLIDEELNQFWKDRIRELQYVLEHRELAWFREKQASTVVEMNTALKKLETFTESYTTQRAFLLTKIEEREALLAEASVEQPSPHSFASGIDESSSVVVESRTEEVQLSFIQQNAEGLLRQMDKEKESFILAFGTCFTHHVKDEFVEFLPKLLEQLDTVKGDLVAKMVEDSALPMEQTRLRTQVDFSLDGVIEQFLTVQALEANERRLNNFMRDLPEHVAVAASEVSRQWEERQAGGVAAGTPTNFGALFDFGGTQASLKDEERTLLARTLAYSSAHAEGAYSPADGFNIKEELRYVHEAWRLASVTVKVHQLATYNLHDVKNVTNQLSTSVLSYIGLYVSSLESAIAEQKQLIAQCHEDAQEVVRTHKELEPYIGKFGDLLAELEGLCVRDLPSAERHVLNEAE